MRKSVVLHGDAKLPELRHVLANCPKAKAFSYDQCKVLTAKTASANNNARSATRPMPAMTTSTIKKPPRIALLPCLTTAPSGDPC